MTWATWSELGNFNLIDSDTNAASNFSLGVWDLATTAAQSLLFWQAAQRLHEVFFLPHQHCKRFSKHPPLAVRRLWCQRVLRPLLKILVYSRHCRSKNWQNLYKKCEQDVSNVWFVKFLYSLLGLPSLQQGSGGLMPELSLLRKHVCVLRRSANEAQPTRRWSCCGVTFDLWEALSLRLGCPWRGRGAPHLPQGSSWGQRGEPPSCSFQHQHRPIDRPQEGGGGRGGRREEERRGTRLISPSLCFHQPNKAGNYFHEHVQ